MPRACRACRSGFRWCIATKASPIALTDRWDGSRTMDDLTQNELEHLLAVYREQTLHLLDEMTADLLAVESGNADEDAVARLRRAAHTIKGDSVCVMLDGVAEIAHRIEDLMAVELSHGGDFNREAVDVMLEGLDLVRGGLEGEQVQDVGSGELQAWAHRLADNE